MKSRTALISVYRKEGVVEFARTLTTLGWNLISTGGTSRQLKGAGLEVRDVSEVTGHPECFDGRVKTLHPAIHSGLLSRRGNENDQQTLDTLGYQNIDLVCVNLYPFQETAAVEPPVDDADLIEMIDIGGPTMIRSAAKNHRDVVVVTSPSQYDEVLIALKQAEGDPTRVSQGLRKKLALQAFQATSTYDSEVANELDSRFIGETLPIQNHVSTENGVALRYGENPHQVAAFYPGSKTPNSLAAAVKISGKPLSYNNYLDLDAALKLVTSLMMPEFQEMDACVIVKHTNPCGVAIDESQEGAWANALSSDPESAFGCVIAFSKVVSKSTAEAIGDHFLECIIAPDYDEEAIEILSSKKNRRILSLSTMAPRRPSTVMKQIQGGWLAQTQGPPEIDWNSAENVTKKQFTDSDILLAKFGTSVISDVKSNAILLVSSSQTGFATVGIGPGQTSRVEAVRIAARRAGNRAKGSMMISDAFFPFRDGIDTANEIGVAAIVQPGGSIRDPESILAADEHGMSMVFTKTRLFLH